jgi:hypothetical protein
MTSLLRYHPALSSPAALALAVALILVAVVLVMAALQVAGSVATTPDGTMLAPFRWIPTGGTSA